MAISYLDKNQRRWAVTGAPPSLRATGDYPGSPAIKGITQADLAAQIEIYAAAHPPPPAPTENESNTALIATLVLLGIGALVIAKR